jgi:hypothetical protein
VGCLFLKWTPFFEAAGAVEKIELSLSLKSGRLWW